MARSIMDVWEQSIEVTTGFQGSALAGHMKSISMPATGLQVILMISIVWMQLWR
jgi:hypothetical protein